MSTLTSVVACSLVVRSNRDQCVSDADCVGHGLRAGAVCLEQVCSEPTVTTKDATPDQAEAAPEDPVWGCLGHVPPLPLINKSVPVHFAAKFQGLFNTAPLTGLPVKACTLLDVACNQPLEGTPKPTDENGIVDVLLYSGFRGYLDIGKSDAYPGLMPSLAYVQPIPTALDGGAGDAGPAEPKISPTLLTKDEVNYYATIAGVTIKPEFGVLLYTAVDCQGNPAADTTLRVETVTADTKPFYLDDEGTPSLTQGKTGASGQGGYLNLPVGSVGVTLSRVSGTKIASQNVIIRASTITYTLFEPSP